MKLLLKIKGTTGSRSRISASFALMCLYIPDGHFLAQHFVFFENYHLCSEVGANSRRVVRQIPDEVLNNTELQDAVRQVKNGKICLA